MYQFWYDYIKPSHGYNTELCEWIQITLSFLLRLNVFMITQKMMLKKTLHASKNEINRQLTKVKNKEVIGLMKDKLSGKIITNLHDLEVKHILM